MQNGPGDRRRWRADDLSDDHSNMILPERQPTPIMSGGRGGGRTAVESCLGRIA
jgi:hypothetical protein